MPAPVLAVHEWPPSTPAAGASEDADRRVRPIAVLVHGLTGWHRTWRRLGPALADRGWRVVGVDQLGHGHSPRIDGAATIDDFADALLATLDVHAPAPLDLLLGHSLGAVVSLRVAQRRPERVRRLVLEDPPAIDRTADEAFLAAIPQGVTAARERPEDEVARELVEHPRWERDDVRQNVEGRALADADGLVASMRRPRPFDVVEAASALPMPVLWVLASPDESVLPPEARARLRRTLPAPAEIAELDSGHTVHRSRYAEYEELLLGWLARTGAT